MSRWPPGRSGGCVRNGRVNEHSNNLAQGPETVRIQYDGPQRTTFEHTETVSYVIAVRLAA
jgi:hypothetical protein